MLRCLLAATSLLGMMLGFIAPIAAQPAAPSVPPELALFANYDETLATLSVTRTYSVELPVTLETVNAAGITEKKVIKVPELREEVLKYLLAESTIKTVGGKELDRQQAAKQLKKGQPIILVAAALKLPAAYKSLFRDDAIILEVKALGTIPNLDGEIPGKP